MASATWLTKFRKRLHGNKSQPLRWRPSALSLYVEQLEDRITPDATIQFGAFNLKAIGADAKFETLYLQDFQLAPQPVGESLGGGNQLQVIRTKSPVEVSRRTDFGNNGFGSGSSSITSPVLFTLPDGGQFRSMGTGSSNSSISYADIVPRYGLISVANGLPSNTTFAQQQQLTLNPAIVGSSTFTLAWNGQTTPSLSMNATADQIQVALMNLSNIGPAGGTVDVAKGTGRTFTITFGGTILSQSTLLVAKPTGIGGTSTIAPVTQVYLTKRDTSTAAVNSDGFNSFIMPLVSQNAVSELYTGTQPSISRFFNQTSPTAFWTIPKNLATTFPTSQSSAFTTTSFGLYPDTLTKQFGGNYPTTTKWEVRLLGNMEFPSAFAGSVQVGDAALQTTKNQLSNSNTNDVGFARQIPTSKGFALVAPNQSTLNVLSAGVDNTGTPRPITFSYGGLNFSVSTVTPIKLTYDTATNSLKLPSGTGYQASAPFSGGELLLRFNALSINLATGAINVGTPSLLQFLIGGFPIYGGRDASIAYDSATTKFTLTIAAQEISSEVVATFDDRGSVRGFPSARRPDPMKISLGAGTMTITKGVLDPITNYPVTGFSIGRSDPTFDLARTTYQPFTSNATGSLSLMYTSANTYNLDGTVKVPANSVGIYGTAKTNLSVAGVTIPGTVNLGSKSSSPGLVITSGSVNRLVFPITQVKAGGFTFTGTFVDSATPLMASYYPPLSLSEAPSYLITGGADMAKDGTIFAGAVPTIFGGNGTEGLRIIPKNGSFKFGFALRNTLQAGTNVIQAATGPDGLKVLYDPATQIYNVRGDAFVFIGTTGAKLAVTATTPQGVSGFATNPLNATSLNLFIKDSATINGFTLSPLATANPLRLTFKPTTTEMTGDFALPLEGYELAGTVSPALLTNGAFPSAGLNLRWDQVGGGPRTWVLGGVLLSDLSPATLTDQLRLPFRTSRFEGQPLATGLLGSEPNIVTARNGRGVSAVITNATAQQVGDMKFNNFTATFQFQTTPQAWVFSGPGTYFGNSITAGGAGNPSVKIGGNAATGYQLGIGNTPAQPTPPPTLPAPSTVTLSGVTFEVGKLTQTAVNTVVDGKVYSYSFPEYTVRIGRTDLTLSGTLQIKVSISGAQVTSFAATAKQNSAFVIGNASFQVNALAVAYDFLDKSFKISGSAKFTYQAAGSSVDMDVTMGDAAEPGLVIKDGTVQTLKVSVNGTFTFMKLTATVPEAKALTLEYNRAEQAYLIYGKVLLSTAAQNGIRVIDKLAVSLGTSADKPGIRIVSGSVDSVDIALNGNINLFSLKASPKNLRLRYTAESNQLQITGGVEVTLANGLVLKAGLPGKGLLIDTATGKVEIRGVSLASDGDIRFGTLTIKNLNVVYADDGTNVTIAAGANLVMPSGLEVGGSFKLVNGVLDSISISLTKNPGILIAGGLVNIYSISGSIEGLADLNNFKLKATVKATVGPAVSFAGKTYALADVTGSITVTPNDLTLDGNVNLVGGIFGKGTFKGVLSWGTDPAKMTFDATVELYPGGVIRGKIRAYIDLAGNVDFNASIGAFVPRGTPIVGDQSLGQLAISLRVRPAEPAANSYVSFDMQILNVGGGIKANFDSNIDYNLRADFGFFKVRKRGSFSLRDAIVAPTVQIVSASAIPGTPDGEVVIAATTEQPESTVIDIYADTDGSGDNGLLIGSVLYQPGNQTVVWKNMAAFAAPGQDVYLYAVINDLQGPLGYSDYSAPFSTDAGFVPAIYVPASQNFGPGQPVVFSSASDNTIVIDDPRLANDPESIVQVIVNVGGGTLDFTQASETVSYTGIGTDRLVLQGTATDINMLLDGLTYTPIDGSFLDDELTVGVSFMPLQNLAGEVTATIPLTITPLTLELAASAYDHGNDGTTVTRNAVGARPFQTLIIDDIASNFLTGARVAIDHYQPGANVLGFSIIDELSTGLQGSFDPDTGILSLAGFGTIHDYQDALRRVTFFTSAAGIQSLTVSLADDHGDQGSLTVPLAIVDGVAPPSVAVGNLGLKYTQGDAAAPLSPTATITVPVGTMVSGMTVAFTPGTYHPGEDVLAYTGGTIPASFDAVAGVLIFTGSFTAADYQQALREVLYAHQGAAFTPGLRGVVITVADDTPAKNAGTALAVIAADLTATNYASPTVTLSLNSVEMAADEEFIQLDPNLQITDSVSTLTGAVVTITNGYVPGKDILGLGEMVEGIDVAFDPATGELRLSGFAPVEAYEFVLRSVVLQNLDRDRSIARTVTPTFTIFNGLSSPSNPQSINADMADAPFLDAGLGNALLYTQGKSTVVIDAGITIDYPVTISGATVAISAGYSPGEDQLVFVNQNGIVGTFDSSTGVLTLTGTAAPMLYQSAIESVRYHNTRFNPVAGDRIVTFRVFDGTEASNIVQVDINIAPVVVGPVITLVSAPQTYIESGPPILVAAGITLDPADATLLFNSWDPVLHGAVVDIPYYIPGEDVLAFVNQGNISGRWDAIEGRLFLEGDDTLANYQAALRTVTYANSSEAPDTTPRTVFIRLRESGANGFSNNVSSTIVIQSIAEPPVRTAGTITGLGLIENQKATSLGLESLRYAPAASVNAGTVRLSFTPTHLPSEALGIVSLADGRALLAGETYPISELPNLRFVPAPRGHGSDNFSFDVVMADANTGNPDGGKLGQTVGITVQGVTTRTSSEAYIAQVYRDLYGANPTAAVLRQWAITLDTKLANAVYISGVETEKFARMEVVSVQINTNAFRLQQIATIYQQLLGRVPTTTERSAALANLANGGTFATLRSVVVGTEEYFQAHSDGVNTGPDYIDALYADLLGRPATTLEETLWLTNFQSGGTHASIALAIGNLPEAIRHSNDTLFVQYLRRHATDEEATRYNAGKEVSLIIDLLCSYEYFASYSTPSTSPYIPNQVTSGYTAVGKLGDAGGDKAGGTLIAPQYVLVAAHSVAGIPPGQLTFTIGGVVHRIDKVFINPDYDPHALGSEGANDIAILKLDQPVNTVVPARLLNGTPSTGNVLKLVGFGAHNGTDYGIKRVGTTPPVNQVTPTQFTWRYDRIGDTDSTQGDSGSPLFVSFSGVEVVAGIVSGGSDPAAGLGDIATNTRVDAYLDWIQSKTGALNLAALPVSLATIIGKPALVSKLKTSTFTFSGTYGGVPSSNLTFQVSLDGRAFVSIVGSTFTTPTLADGQHSLVVRAVDADGNTGPATQEFVWTIDATPRLIALSRTNGLTNNLIDWVDSKGATVWSIAVPAGFGAPTVASISDRTGDGFADVVIGSQAGLYNRVGIVDGKSGDLLWSTNPFVSTFKGGVNVAVGDITGDSVPEVIVAPASAGGPNVRAFQQSSGSFNFTMIRDYHAYIASYTGGVNVAVADVNKDGIGDIITGTARFSDNVRVFSAGVGTSMIADFFAFKRTGVIPGYVGGVSVAGADINNDGYADIITGTQTQYSRVRVYSGGVNAGMNNTPNTLLMDFTTSTSKIGVLVMALDFGTGKSGIATLTDTGSSIMLNAYGYSGSLAPTNLLSKAYTRPLSGAPPVRLG